jgi:hypothetical protein
MDLCWENERIAENGEKWKWFRKPTISLYIMDAHITESSYILADPYRIQNSLNEFAA